MGVIKDIVDLSTQLTDKAKDTKFASEAREILKMVGELQSEHSEIRERNIQLMQENADLRKEIESLKQRKEQTENQKKEPAKHISKEEEAILLLLSETERATADEIAHRLQYNMTKIKHWLECLHSKGMVCYSLAVGQPIQYRLGQGGRGYLIENQLIK